MPLCRRRRRAAASLPCRAAIRQRDWTAARRWKNALGKFPRYKAQTRTVTDAADALKEWQANRPGDYQSSYQERIDQLLNQLLQRESFQYSYTKDPLYRQYEQNYLQNAHNASADAAAQAAALTGGYGSSYATSAAQQAYQQQIGALSSAIPTLYSLALDTYTSGGNELVSQLDQLNNSEQDAQQQYNNKLSDYYTQLKQKAKHTTTPMRRTTARIRII